MRQLNRALISLSMHMCTTLGTRGNSLAKFSWPKAFSKRVASDTQGICAWSLTQRLISVMSQGWTAIRLSDVMETNETHAQKATNSQN